MRKKLTVFAVPKAFEGHTECFQRNAIESWRRLPGEIEIFLMGTDAGVAEIANEFSLRHFPEISRNKSGTPLLDDVFRIAHENSNSRNLMYVNSDIVLTRNLVGFVDSMDQLGLEKYLAIGMRRDFDQETPIHFDSDWEERITTKAIKHGKYASILCKDYFLFSENQYRDIPAFSIGRGNWDSWMVSTASLDKVPVIDATHQIFAGHQNHDHGHAGGRMKAYVSGAEAKHNIRLAGGTRYVSGSIATHRLTNQGKLKRVNRVKLLPLFRDLPRLAKQLISFLQPLKSDQDLNTSSNQESKTKTT